MKYLALFAILFAASYGEEEEDDDLPYNFRTDVCYTTCAIDDNCPDDLVCVIDQCLECGTDDNCVDNDNYDDNGNPLNFCVNNACVECVESEDCGGPSRRILVGGNSVCVSNACVDCDIAKNDTDCSNPNLPYCVVTDCVACTNNTHCTDPLRDVCNPTTGQCVDCYEDDYCASTTVQAYPFCVNDWCSVCKEDSDCAVELDRVNNPDYVFCDVSGDGGMCEFSCMDPVNGTECDPSYQFCDVNIRGTCIDRYCNDTSCESGGQYGFSQLCSDEYVEEGGPVVCVDENWMNSPDGQYDYCYRVYNRSVYALYPGETEPDFEAGDNYDFESCMPMLCHPDGKPCSDRDENYVAGVNPFSQCFTDPDVVVGQYIQYDDYHDGMGICIEPCGMHDPMYCAETIYSDEYGMSCRNDTCGMHQCDSTNTCGGGYSCSESGYCSPTCSHNDDCQYNFDYDSRYFCQVNTTMTCEMKSCSVSADCPDSFICNDDDKCTWGCGITNCPPAYKCGPDDECIPGCTSDSECRFFFVNVATMGDVGNLYACNTTSEECYYAPDAPCTATGSWDWYCQKEAEYVGGESSGISSLYACNTTTAECYYTPQSCTFDDGSGFPIPCECDEAIGVDGCTTNPMAGEPLYRCVQVDGAEGVCVASDNCVYQESEDTEVNPNGNPKWCQEQMFFGNDGEDNMGAVCDPTTWNCVNTFDCRNGAGCANKISFFTGMHKLCPNWPFEVPCNQGTGFCGGEEGPGHVTCSSDFDCDTGHDYVCSTVKMPDGNGNFPGTCTKKCSGDADCDGLFCIDINPADGVCDVPAISAMSCDVPSGQCIFGDDKDQCGDNKQCGKLPGGVDQICMTLIPFLPNMCYVDCSADVASAAGKTQDAVCGDAFKGRWANYEDIKCVSIDEGVISVSFCNDGKPGLDLMDIIADYFIGVTSAPTQSPATNPIASAIETTDPNAGGAAQIKIFAAIVMVGVIKLFM
eukprot:149638_1